MGTNTPQETSTNTDNTSSSNTTTNNNTIEDNKPVEATTENNERIPIEELNAPNTTQEGTIQGSFRSLEGARKKVTCYCHDSGIITTKNGKTINVCFKNTTMPEESCSSIKVKGAYETIKKSPESSSPCAGGSMNVFMASTPTSCL
ncbi:MAG: hypothetical protein GY810_24650 [Aureispira sp.]|nr:hypothetical protein [Aureispira sp.]